MFSIAGGGWLNDQRKIGLGLTAFGMLFTVIGMMLFFDRGFIALGNLLFVAGLCTTIGLKATLAFFTKRKNRKGSAFYFGGLLVVLGGYPLVGLIVEAYGFWLLFCEFIPTALQFFRRTPFLGKLLDLPVLKMIMNKVAPLGGLPTSNFQTKGM